jgi:hypothetical protein
VTKRIKHELPREYWSEEQMKRLISLCWDGETDKKLAEILKRTPYSIHSIRRKQGVPYKTIPLIIRLMNKVEMIPESGCWIWMGACNNKGYGQINNGIRKELAHRLFYKVHGGILPDDVCLLHDCDTPLCVNPHHMFKGTMKDNTQDMLKKHRNNNAKGEKNPAYKHITVDMMLDAIQNSPNKKIASRALGISTETLRSKIRLYKIEREVELCQVIAK